jgi:hypothetical protein
VPPGVVGEIAHDLVATGRVEGQCLLGGVGDVEDELELGCEQGQPLDLVLAQPRQVDLAARQRLPLGRGVRCAAGGDEVGGAGGLTDHDGQQPVPILVSRAAQQQLCAATDAGERRAQLVGGIGQEPTAALLSGLRLGQGGLQLQQRAVERLGHPPLLGDVASHR